MIEFTINFLIPRDPRFMVLGVLGSVCGVFLPFYLCMWPLQYVLYGSALIFFQLLVQLAIGQHDSLKGGDGYRSVTSGDVYIFLVESCYIDMQGYALMLEDLIYIISRHF